MDQQTENDIISALEKDIEECGSCSIKQAAQSVFYNNITLTEQKNLAKLIVKKHHFISQINGDEIIVSKNLTYIENNDDTTKDYEILKYLIYVIASVCAYLVFKVLLPSITK